MQLKKIVDYINTTISDALTDRKYDNANYAGIAIAAPKMNGSDIETFPCYINDASEATYLGYNDEYPVQVYHKDNGISYVPAVGGNYGDKTNILTATANMSMIITGFREKLKMSPEELNEQFLFAMPSNMAKATAAGLNLISCQVTPVNSDLNFMNVFTREYKVKTMKIAPIDIMMLELKYKIECRFDKSCINT